MRLRATTLLVFALFAAPLSACHGGKRATYDPKFAESFFPLEPNSLWTYRITSKSQHQTYVVTDQVVGEKYIPSLNLTGQVVQEYYNMDRGGTRPLVYFTKNGYLSRLSGLNYSKADIEAPAWGRSEESEFLPQHVFPDLSWTSKTLPFGHLAGSFDIAQVHRSFFQAYDVVVPAGSFSGCIRIESRALYEGGAYATPRNRNLSLVYEDYYAPNVGLIKTVALEGSAEGSEVERVELLKFKIEFQSKGFVKSSRQDQGTTR
jgi:hypothetical protein